MSDLERIDDDLAHSPLGPSAANGWATCADYVNANAGLPNDSSYVAAEGTHAHAISDLCLSVGFDAADFIGQSETVEQWTFTWTEEDAQLLQRGIDTTRRLGGQFYGERRVDISPWTIEGQFGTLDRAIVVKEADGVWWIHIIDLKWGRWPVYPVENLQLILYALGFWNDVAGHMLGSDDQVRFALSIDQPRSAGGGGTWYVTLDELLEWGEWLRERALATQQPNPPRTASSAGCAFCRRKLPSNGGCATYEAFNTSLFADQFEDLDAQALIVPQPGAITPERRSFILSHRKMLETWMDQLAEAELLDYLAGLPTPGRKAVTDTQKGTRAKWKDEAAATAALVPILGEASFTKKLKTPQQVLKIIPADKATEVSEHILPGEAGTSMVPLGDKRPAIPLIAGSDFDDVTE